MDDKHRLSSHGLPIALACAALVALASGGIVLAAAQEPPARGDVTAQLEAMKKPEGRLAQVKTDVSTNGVWREWSEDSSDGGKTWVKGYEIVMKRLPGS